MTEKPQPSDQKTPEQDLGLGMTGSLCLLLTDKLATEHVSFRGAPLKNMNTSQHARLTLLLAQPLADRPQAGTQYEQSVTESAIWLKEALNTLQRFAPLLEQTHIKTGAQIWEEVLLEAADIPRRKTQQPTPNLQRKEALIKQFAQTTWTNRRNTVQESQIKTFAEIILPVWGDVAAGNPARFRDQIKSLSYDVDPRFAMMLS